MPLQINGVTSGSATLQATNAATVTLTLPGTTGTVLSTGSPQSGGVIQVVQATSSTFFSTTSFAFVDIGLSASITPKFATSRILISACITGLNTNGSSNNGGALQLVYNSTAILQIDNAIAFTNASGVSDNYVAGTSTDFLHSPATTSSITYKIQGRLSQNNTGNFRIMPAGGTSTITLLEIAS